MAGNSLKAAPRRPITDITRVGDWGEIEWHHQLGCGHVEIRPRKAAGQVMACSGCLTARAFAAGMVPAAATPAPTWTDDDVLVDLDAHVEAEIARIRAGLANRLGVSTEAVDVAITTSTGTPQIAYALVFVDADTARRYLG